MIKIINGCTRINGRLITSASGPISTDPVQEAFLVSRGVAEYIGSPPVNENAHDDSGESESGSGGDDLIVTGVCDFANGNVTDFSHTATEIWDAIIAQRPVVGRFSFVLMDSTAYIDMGIQTAISTELGISIIFNHAVAGASYAVEINGESIECKVDGSIPEYDEEDDVGKVLSVASEGLAWVTP